MAWLSSRQVINFQMLIPKKKKKQNFFFLVFHLEKLYHCSNQQVKLVIINWLFDNLLRTQFIILIFDHLCGPPKKSSKTKKPT